MNGSEVEVAIGVRAWSKACLPMNSRCRNNLLKQTEIGFIQSVLGPYALRLPILLFTRFWARGLVLHDFFSKWWQVRNNFVFWVWFPWSKNCIFFVSICVVVFKCNSCTERNSCSCNCCRIKNLSSINFILEFACSICKLCLFFFCRVRKYCFSVLGYFLNININSVTILTCKEMHKKRATIVALCN